MKTPDTETNEGDLVQRLELLLNSLTAVVSARVILDSETEPHVHILATAEIPLSEVSRAVTSALTWGFGFEVPPEQITIAQSRLSREELNILLGSPPVEVPTKPIEPAAEPSGSAFVPVALMEAPARLPDLEASPREAGPPNSEAPIQDAGSPNPKAPAGDMGLLEFSLQGTSAAEVGAPEPQIHRLELQDLQLNRKPQGGFGILVRLTGNDRSIGAQRDADGTKEDALEVPASAALGVIQEFLRSADDDGIGVVLRFLAARRLHTPEQDVVVVLVEADVGGRRIPLTGAASAYQGVERASILATLQATNAFVADTLAADPSKGTWAR
jgi:hypothetical protein